MICHDSTTVTKAVMTGLSWSFYNLNQSAFVVCRNSRQCDKVTGNYSTDFFSHEDKYGKIHPPGLTLILWNEDESAQRSWTLWLISVLSFSMDCGTWSVTAGLQWSSRHISRKTQYTLASAKPRFASKMMQYDAIQYVTMQKEMKLTNTFSCLFMLKLIIHRKSSFMTKKHWTQSQKVSRHMKKDEGGLEGGEREERPASLANKVSGCVWACVSICVVCLQRGVDTLHCWEKLRLQATDWPPDALSSLCPSIHHLSVFSFSIRFLFPGFICSFTNVTCSKYWICKAYSQRLSKGKTFPLYFHF